MKTKIVHLLCTLTALMFLFASDVSAADLDISCDAEELITTLSTANATPEADVLTLAEGCIYTLTQVNNSADGANGLPSIFSNIMIQGNGSVIQRSIVEGTPAFRIFHVATSGKLTVERLTILNGWAHSEQASDPARSGGGIYSQGAVTLTHSVVSDNLADFHGGGIFTRGVLVLDRSVISNNRADGRLLDASQTWGWGGGIRSERGLVTVDDSVIMGNSSGSSGGGNL